MLPNFLVVGAQKAGTTSLHNYLVQHPQIYLPAKKETKFFASAERYAKGIQYYEDTFFSDYHDEHAVGEVDPDYMYFPEALIRLEESMDLEKLKIIFILRNPVERAYSHYLMTYRRGLEPLAFEDAIKEEHTRIKKDWDSKLHYSYMSRGYYYDQLMLFDAKFNPDQMLFVLNEDMRHEIKETLRKMYGFLGVDSSFIPDNIGEKYHESTIPRSMSLLKRIQSHGIEEKIARALLPQHLRTRIRKKLQDLNQAANHDLTMARGTRERLIERFIGQNNLLEGYINRDLSMWNRLS